MSKASPASGPPTFDAQTWLRAADAGDTARVESLLAAGAHVNAASDGGETALMRAASKGHLDVVRALLDAGADLEARSENGFTALVVAVFFGHAEVVRTLLAKGANPDAWTRLGATAENWARSSGHTEIVELLQNADAARAQDYGARSKATNKIRGDATEFFSGAGAFLPVVPLADVGGVPAPPEDGPPTEAVAAVDEAREVAPVEERATETEEREETTLVPARARHSTSLQPRVPRARGVRAAMPPRFVAALTLGLILGVVAGAFAVWKNSQRPATTRQPALLAEEVHSTADGANTQAALPQPPAPEDIKEPQPAPQPTEPGLTNPKPAKTDGAELASAPSGARPRAGHATGTAPPPRPAATDEARGKRPAATAVREDGDPPPDAARRVARATRRPQRAETQVQTSSSPELSLPVSSPKPAATPGSRKVIPWP